MAKKKGSLPNILKNVGNLRGFSTSSSFLRPSNVADMAINMVRNPEGSFAARRGYQCQTSDFGGLGTGTYHITSSDTIGVVTVNDDGLLYKRNENQLYMYYDGRVLGDIIGATNAAICEIQTSVNHGLSTGAKVTIRNVLGMTQINNLTFTITVTGLDTFQLDGVNSLAYGVYAGNGDWVITFTENKFLVFNIFTDPRYLPMQFPGIGWSYGAWGITPWGAPGGESISCQITVNAAGQINGNQTAVNTLVLWFGHELETNDTVVFVDSLGITQTRTVTAFTDTSIDISGPAVSVINGVFVSQFFDILFKKGFDVIPIYTIQNFIDRMTDPVNGIEGLKVAVTGLTSTAAAFLAIIEPIIIDHNTVYTIPYYDWKAVNRPMAALTFPSSADPDFVNSDAFENATFASFDDVVYIANGMEYPQKFDDQTVYLAGMTQGVRPLSVVSAGAGKLSSGTYYYATTYEQVDNLKHVVEGAISDRFQSVFTGLNNATVTVSNILSTSGYNTNCAIAKGGAATVYGPDSNGFYYDFIETTFNSFKKGDTAFFEDERIAKKDTASAAAENKFKVFAPHGLKVGDVVTFASLVPVGVTQIRIVREVTATEITLNGKPVTVDANVYFKSNIAVPVFGNVAISSAAQTGVNAITVVAGHTIQLGDVVSFTDADGRLQRRTITASAAGSITVSGIPVNIGLSALIACDTLRLDAINVQKDNASISYITAAKPISNNLRINIWRTVRDGTQLYLLATIPNDSTATTQTFLDTIIGGPESGNISDATQAALCSIESIAHGLENNDQIGINDVLGMTQLNGRNYTITYVDADNFTLNGINSVGYDAYTSGGSWTKVFSESNQSVLRYPNPDRPPNPPPVCKYLLTFGNQLLYAGGKNGESENDDNVFFSEGNFPESVPTATNYFSVPAQDQQITGIGVSGTTLIVTKSRSLYAITGSILTSQYQLTQISPGSNIGCVAHATIQPVGSLLYFLSATGVYAVAENQLYPTDAFGNPVAISSSIEVIFKERNFLPQTQFISKRAVAVNYSPDEQYLLFLPCEDSQATGACANQNSFILCFDYPEKNWFKWDNMNAAGGIFTIGRDLYFQERRSPGFSVNLYKQHRKYRLVDHADHAGTQNVQWRSSWEDVDEPAVRKKFVRCMLLIDRISDLNQFNDPQMYFSTYVDRIPNLQSTVSQITTENNTNLSGWSTAPWSFGAWSGYQDSFARINLKGGTVAKAIQIGFQTLGINTDFRLSGFQLEVILENRSTIVR